MHTHRQNPIKTKIKKNRKRSWNRVTGNNREWVNIEPMRTE